ncbi:hypothetical protein PInf_009428 [Phytophthora infestans]|nr:hypothetical protein PInf_009428 [Phytophthora infestans]
MVLAIAIPAEEDVAPSGGSRKPRKYHGDKAGKWPKTREDVVIFTLSVKFNKALDNKGKDMFLSHLAQHEKKVSYGSSYVKLIFASVGNVNYKLPPAGGPRVHQADDRERRTRIHRQREGQHAWAQDRRQERQ